MKFSTTDEQDETGKIAHQKRHPAAGEVALHPLHPGGTAHLRTSGMGAALQLGGRLQCRTARRTHLHRTDHPGPAGQHPHAGRRSAGHLDLPLPRRIRFRQPGARLRAYVPRTERLAVQTTCRLFRRQIRSRIPSHVPHAACQTLPGKIPQGHPRSPLRRTHRPLDRPDFGPGIRAEKTLRYPARPHSRPNLSPRHRLHRMGNPAQIPAPELEHGHGLQPA